MRYNPKRNQIDKAMGEVDQAVWAWDNYKQPDPNYHVSVIYPYVDIIDLELSRMQSRLTHEQDEAIKARWAL